MSFPQLRSSGARIAIGQAILSAPTVITNDATSIGPTSAVGNGEVTSDGNSTITERGFCWSTSPNPTTADSKVIVAGTIGVYSDTMSPLIESTAYHYRAYAINAIDTSYGADKEFTTTAATSFVSKMSLMGVG